METTVLSTGKTYAWDGTYEWQFDAAGKVREWRSVGDMAGVEAAFCR